MRRSLVASAAAVLLALAAPGRAAGPPPPASPEGLLLFGEALLAHGDSFRAATEYLRFLVHFPDHPEAPQALAGLGQAYAAAGRWDDAAGAFARLAETDPGARLRLGAALYRGERYGDAARVLLAPGGDPAAEVLGTLALLRQGEGAAAARGPRPDLAEAYRSLPRVSPAAAGALAAVLPGAGHWYADRPRDAAVALVLNGATLWATWEAARREQWALVGVLGALELGWYAGNVTSAVTAAHKWNRREEGRFLRRWEEGAVPRWGVAPLPGGVGGTLRWEW